MVENFPENQNRIHPCYKLKQCVQFMHITWILQEKHTKPRLELFQRCCRTYEITRIKIRVSPLWCQHHNKRVCECSTYFKHISGSYRQLRNKKTKKKIEISEENLKWGNIYIIWSLILPICFIRSHLWSFSVLYQWNRIYIWIDLASLFMFKTENGITENSLSYRNQTETGMEALQHFLSTK